MPLLGLLTVVQLLARAALAGGARSAAVATPATARQAKPLARASLERRPLISPPKWPLDRDGRASVNLLNR
jgi:hypothetical protein